MIINQSKFISKYKNNNSNETENKVTSKQLNKANLDHSVYKMLDNDTRSETRLAPTYSNNEFDIAMISKDNDLNLNKYNPSQNASEFSPLDNSDDLNFEIFFQKEKGYSDSFLKEIESVCSEDIESDNKLNSFENYTENGLFPYYNGI